MCVAVLHVHSAHLELSSHEHASIHTSGDTTSHNRLRFAQSAHAHSTSLGLPALHEVTLTVRARAALRQFLGEAAQICSLYARVDAKLEVKQVWCWPLSLSGDLPADPRCTPPPPCPLTEHLATLLCI